MDELFFHVPAFRIRPLAGPELRKDPIIDRRVIISTDRLGRPQELSAAAAPLPLAQCPFCAGHEHLTPDPVYVRPAKGPWQVRVVPNTFPAVRGEGEFRASTGGPGECGPAVGIHEVVIACPQHESRLARLLPGHLAELFRAFRERIRFVKRERPELYPIVFNNCKAAAGASLEHAHSQFLAAPLIPELAGREIAAGRRHHSNTGRCIFCDLIASELAGGARVVLESPGFVALAAYAARFPCELWLLPRGHASHFEAIDDAGLAELGEVFWRLLNKLDRGLDDPPCNFFLHTAPPAGPDLAGFHWHFEFLPRLTGTAGFEWATGMNINPVPPEQAAEYLRGIDI